LFSLKKKCLELKLMSDLISDLFFRVPPKYLENADAAFFTGAFLRAFTADFLAMTELQVQESVCEACREFDLQTQRIQTSEGRDVALDSTVAVVRALMLKLLAGKVSNWNVARLYLSREDGVATPSASARLARIISGLARDTVGEVFSLFFSLSLSPLSNLASLLGTN